MGDLFTVLTNSLLRARGTAGMLFSKMEPMCEHNCLQDPTQAIATIIAGQFLDSAKVISVKGMPDLEGKNPDGCWVIVDPLNGQTNFETRDTSQMLPYTSCVTVLSKRAGATFADIEAAGVIDLRGLGKTQHIWGAKKTGTGYETFVSLSHPARTMTGPRLTTGMTISSDLYYPGNRNLLCRMFSDTRISFMCSGSTARDMATVASGQIAAYVSEDQNPFDLGAAYALVKGAGGFAKDFAGRDLGSRPFNLESHTPVVLAANEGIKEDVLGLVERYAY